MDYEVRKQRIENLLNTAIEPNGYEVPDKPARYLVVEYGGWHKQDIWAYDVGDLGEAAQAIDSSDTEGVTDITVYDLDNEGVEHYPVRTVVRWLTNQPEHQLDPSN